MTPTIEVLVQSHLTVARERSNLNRYRVAAAASQHLLQETPVDWIPLSVLPRELARLTRAEPPAYRRCYGLALDGRLPTELVNGRHRVNRKGPAGDRQDAGHVHARAGRRGAEVAEAGARDMIPDVIEQVALLGWHCYPRAPHCRAAAFTGAAQQATCSLATLDRWAREYPDCGWYAVTGSSGIWALDVDAPPKADGIAAMACVTAKHGTLPHAPTIRTGGGGWCIIFRHQGEPLRGHAGALAVGIDPRRGAQTITLPPTLHHVTGRPYRWVTPPWLVAPPVAPGWLLKALALPPDPVVADYPYAITNERAQRALYRAVYRLRNSSEGSRNDALNRSAFHVGTLIAGGLLPHRGAEDALMRAAMQAGLPRSEITATLRSAFRAARGFAVS